MRHRAPAALGMTLFACLAVATVTACAQTPQPMSAQPAPAAPAAGALVVDHRCMDAADNLIPADALDRARATQVLFAHQSVGFDVIRGLERLSAAQPRYRLEIGHQIQPAWYRQHRGLGEFFVGRNGDCQGKCADFTQRLRAVGGQVQLASLKYCYADLLEQVDVDQAFGAYRQTMDSLQAEFPQVRMVWWTCPLMVVERLQDKRNRFNTLVREHVRAHGLTLFDLADIESHGPDGAESRDRTGPMLFPGYARDNGHLNDAAAERVARGWWWLVARVAGWPGPA